MPLDVVDQLSLLGETFVAYVAVEGHTTVGSFLVSFQVGDRVVFQGFVVRAKRARKNTCITIETHLGFYVLLAILDSWFILYAPEDPASCASCLRMCWS